MYKKIYFGRPSYMREENKPDGCYQYYQCSYNQLELYFRRFGADAMIISPESFVVRSLISIEWRRKLTTGRSN